MGRLSTETYLDFSHRKSTVNALIPDFENFDKRQHDIFKKRPFKRVKIPGLLGDKEQGLTGSAVKRFVKDFMLLDQ